MSQLNTQNIAGYGGGYAPPANPGNNPLGYTGGTGAAAIPGYGATPGLSSSASTLNSSQQAQNQTLGTSGSTSQYLIPGAQAAYGNILSGLQGGYGGAQGTLQQAYGALNPALQSAYGGLLGSELGAIGTYGQTEEEQLQQQYDQAAAQQAQNLQNRGLGNSTVANSVQTGLTQSQALAQQNLAEQVNQEQLGVLQNVGMPAIQAEQALGSQQIAQALGLTSAGLGAQQAVGSQYLGMVGQQGINTTTGQQQQAGTQSQTGVQTQTSLNQAPQGSGGGGGGKGGGGSQNPQQPSPYLGAGGTPTYGNLSTQNLGNSPGLSAYASALQGQGYSQAEIQDILMGPNPLYSPAPGATSGPASEPIGNDLISSYGGLEEMTGISSGDTDVNGNGGYYGGYA